MCLSVAAAARIVVDAAIVVDSGSLSTKPVFDDYYAQLADRVLDLLRGVFRQYMMQWVATVGAARLALGA